MKRRVLVIGGGPAGLTVAVRLGVDGYRVTLIEQEPRLGGRLIGGHAGAGAGAPVVLPVSQDGEPRRLEQALGSTESLPFVILGHHRATLSLLQTLGTAVHAPFSRRLRLEFMSPAGHTVRLSRPWAPAPFHALLSLIAFRALPVQDRWRLLIWLERNWEKDPSLPSDLDSRTAEDLLAAIGQTVTARTQVWSPLSRFLLGDDLTVVSASMLLSSLARCFLSARGASRVAVPAHSLDKLLIGPAQDALVRAGTQVRLETAADHIRFDAHRVTGVQLRSGEMLTADWYVAALPHRSLTPLLPERALTRFSYFQHLTKLSDSPALTIHLWLDSPLQHPRLQLLAGDVYHWMTCRVDPIAGPGQTLISLVATGKSDVLEQPDKDLLDKALHRVRLALPASTTAKLLASQFIKVPQAFLTSLPGVSGLRPLQQSPFPNLFLAGDWTDTGLPATIESAVLSGDLCAQAIAAKK